MTADPSRSGRTVRLIKMRPNVSRRLPKQFAKDIRRYAMRTGLATWAWNSLHANLFLIFWFLQNPAHIPSKRNMAHGIWNTILNDSTQREMLKIAAEAELAERKHLLRHVSWILSKTNRFSTYRNVAAHTAAVFSHFLTRLPTAEGSSTREPMRLRFNAIDHQRFWKILSADLTALSHYAARVAFEIYRPGFDGPLPNRPRLRSLRQIDKIEGQIGRLAQSAERSLQPSASREKRNRLLADGKGRRA
jgi:hypothetical protein